MKPKIKEIRKSKGLVQKFVAEQMQMTPTQLSDWESGRKYPRIDKAFKLAKVLGVGIEDLYEVE
jgi:putative transcriptional regulator